MHNSATALIAAAMLMLPVAAQADDETPPVVAGKTYVQHQLIQAKASHPEILSIVAEGKRPDGKAVVVLGSTISAAQVFKPAPHAAQPDGAVTVGPRYIVREPFNSSSGHRLGTIEIAFRYVKGREAAFRQTAAAVQAAMARDTLSAKNATDPYPFSAGWGPDTYAQRLTMSTIAKHPDLLVMMIHATPPGGSKNLIVGSNIGRFGKIADDDDLRVIEQGSTNLEVGGDQDRFETELPLNDAAGNRIGALGLVFGYRDGADKEAIHRHGLAIRDEVAQSIPTSAKLFEKTR